MKKITVLLSILICSASISAKGLVEYMSTLPPVNETGYYNVLLSPEAMAFSRWNSFSDIRIKDENNKEVPYILRSEASSIEMKNYTTFPLLENTFHDSINFIVINNSKQEMLDQFCITTKRSKVAKSIILKGSNNKKTWYIVKQEEHASVGFSNADNTEETLVYDFPKGNYKYYQIQIKNEEKAPLQIVSVGKYDYAELLGKFIKLNLFFTQKDSNKNSYIHFPQLPCAYHIDRLDFKINNKENFLRQATLLGDTSRGSSYNSDNTTFILSSNDPTPQLITRDFCITNKAELVIANKDNAPLHIDSVTAYLRCKYICLKLKKGIQYTLYGGSDTTSAPEYDMAYFANNIPKQLPTLNMHPAIIIQKTNNLNQKNEKSFFKSSTFLWLAIGAVGILLLFICLSMIKELSKKN